MITTQKTQPKYTIEEKLKAMQGKYTDNQYKLCIAVGITVKTLENWLKHEKGSSNSIKSDYLFLLCDFFNCQPHDLLNS